VQSAPQGTPYPATDLRSEGLVLDADALCLELTKSLDHWREIWHRKGSSILHATWLERAYGVKGRISVQTRQNRFEGIFEGLDREGRLVLRDFEGKKHDISAGDVYFS
jgi:BirA family biotin operon repressor/biotin-[acetyl-CoA-carboxylase] ligase